MRQLLPRLSDFGIKSQLPSPVNEMTAQFAGDFREGTDINLGVGYVNDTTIPGDMIQKALSEVLSDPVHYRNALNYGGAGGSPALRTAIIDYYTEHRIGGLCREDFENISVCIGANGATSILDSFAEIIEPGIVITADPWYYIYCDTLKRKGFDIITVPEDENGIRIDLLKTELKRIDISRLRFFYIVTVNNPSCTILENDRKKKLIELARSLSDASGCLIPVLFDKAYEDIIHDVTHEKPVSGLKYDASDIVFEIGTFSKVIAPALRIGYMFTRNEAIAGLILQKISDIGFSAPLITQEITAWILEHHISDQLQKVNTGYRIKAETLKEWLYDIIGDDLLEVKGGKAGFYFYLTLSVPTDNGSRFHRYLSRITGDRRIDGHPDKYPRLVYIPGSCCVNPQGAMKKTAEKQLRISYGFEYIDTIRKAIVLIKEAVVYSKSISDQ
jgi:2-aminoadipate transaminase